MINVQAVGTFVTEKRHFPYSNTKSKIGQSATGLIINACPVFGRFVPRAQKQT